MSWPRCSRRTPSAEAETPTPTSRSASTRSSPRSTSGAWPTPPTSSASAAPSTSIRRGATSRPPASTGSRCGCTATSSREIGAIDLAIELGARSLDHLEATGPEGVRQAGRLRRRRRRAADRRAHARPAAAARRARSSTPAACWRSRPTSTPARAPATRCPPSCTSPAPSASLARPRRSRPCTVNAAHVLGIGERAGRLRVGQRADIVAARRARLALPRLPPRQRGRQARDRRGRLGPGGLTECRPASTRSAAASCACTARAPTPSAPRRPAASRRARAATTTPRALAASRAPRPRLPSLKRSARKGAIMAIFLVAVVVVTTRSHGTGADLHRRSPRRRRSSPCSWPSTSGWRARSTSASRGGSAAARRAPQ